MTIVDNKFGAEIINNNGLNLALIGPFKEEGPFQKILNPKS